MARNEIPDALKMRELKYGEGGDATRDEVASRLLAQGRRSEAILLYEGRGGHPFLAAERDWAVSAGDAFHLVSVRRLGCPVGPEHLRACAEAAEARGRWMDARNAWMQLGEGAAVARIAPHLPPSLRPPPVASGEPSHKP